MKSKKDEKIEAFEECPMCGELIPYDPRTLVVGHNPLLCPHCDFLYVLFLSSEELLIKKRSIFGNKNIEKI